MKILLTCGHPFAGLVCAHELLTKAGIGQLQPGARQPAAPTELRASIVAALARSADDVDRDTGLTPSQESHFQGEQIGSAAPQRTDCGWADAGSVWLLEFWKSLSPAISFLLVYSAPKFAIGQMLREQRASPENIGEAVSNWIAWNTEMLRFYHHNPGRCLLVNASAMVHAPVPFISRIVDTFAMAVAVPNASLLLDHMGFPLVASSLAKALIEDREDASALCREMESAADLNTLDASALNSEKHQAWQEYSDLLSRLNEAPKADELLRENELLSRQLEQVREEILQSFSQSQELAETKRKLDETVAKLDEAQTSASRQPAVGQQQTKANQLSGENEFLLLQLHQTQEELEHYFLRWEELASKEREQADQLSAHASLWRNSQPAEVIYDLRHNFDGNNWYPAEADGCWAGPRHVSTMRVSPVGIGTYELQLDVADAMEPGIVNDMEVSLNGTPLKLGKDCKSYPVVVIAQFSTDAISAAPVWEFTFKFAKLMSPSERGSDDSRSLAIRLRTLKLKKV